MLILLAAAVHAALVFNAGASKSSPEPFCNVEAGFCARFPQPPRMSVETENVKGGSGGVMRRFVFHAISDSTVFRVEVGVPPRDYIAFNNPTAFLEAVEAGMKRGRLVRSLSSTAIRFQGDYARRFEYEHQERTGVFKTTAILFIAHRKIYTLSVTCSSDRTPASARENFFSSLRLR